jgi:hypothetical protein
MPQDRENIRKLGKSTQETSPLVGSALSASEYPECHFPSFLMKATRQVKERTPEEDSGVAWRAMGVGREVRPEEAPAALEPMEARSEKKERNCREPQRSRLRQVQSMAVNYLQKP